MIMDIIEGDWNDRDSWEYEGTVKIQQGKERMRIRQLNKPKQGMYPKLHLRNLSLPQRGPDLNYNLHHKTFYIS